MKHALSAFFRGFDAVDLFPPRRSNDVEVPRLSAEEALNRDVERLMEDGRAAWERTVRANADGQGQAA